MTRENRIVFAILAAVVLLVALIGTGRFWLGHSAPSAQGAYVPPTATPSASAEGRAAAAALLADAAAQREAGQHGPALQLAAAALDLWPGYEDADRFVTTVAPEATAAAARADALVNAATQQETARLRTLAEARRAYSARTLRPLQQYADTMGGVRQGAREAGERPTLLDDPTWRTRTSGGLVQMQRAADDMAGVTPVPDGMGPAVALLEQIARETRLLAEDYTPGLAGVTAPGVAAARSRMDRLSHLTIRANAEVRRISAAPGAP